MHLYILIVKQSMPLSPARATYSIIGQRPVINDRITNKARKGRNKYELEYNEFNLPPAPQSDGKI